MRVLLFTDGSAGAGAATMWLKRFAPVEPSALRIVAIAQMPRLPAMSSSAQESLRHLLLDRSRRMCADARARLEGRWRELNVEVIEGDPHEHLLQAAELWKPDLVVLGRSAGIESAPPLGSVARLCGHHLECSVLLVDRAPESVREIVLGMDGSPSAREATRLMSLFTFAPPPRVLALGIVDQSWRHGLTLEDVPPLVQRALDEAESQAVADARGYLTRRTGILANRAIVESEIATGQPAEVLLNASRQRTADLLAIGHQGVEPVRRLTLGSVAAHLLSAAPCSLLIGRK
jgi:nucleotide-binding universal stress UspA family protein